MGQTGLATRTIRIYVLRFAPPMTGWEHKEVWFLSYDGPPAVTLDELVKTAIRDACVRAVFTTSRVQYDAVDGAPIGEPSNWKPLHAIDMSWKGPTDPVNEWPLEKK